MEEYSEHDQDHNFVQNVWPTTQCDQTWRNFATLAKFRHFGKILKVFGQLLKALFTIWQNFEPTLANILCYWANLHPYKWPNIEN